MLRASIYDLFNERNQSIALLTLRSIANRWLMTEKSITDNTNDGFYILEDVYGM